MAKNYAVVSENVSKAYRLYENPNDQIKDLILGKGKAKKFYALKGVSFQVEEGDCIGMLGLNGSGKSTLADIIAGVSMPTEGTITLSGEASLIAIGSGLNAQLTGLENIELKGLMMGLTLDEIHELTPSIIEFADIGEFVKQSVKTYSSGMRARLGFAIAVNIHPDILVVDEALSVGDPTFTQKCLDKMNAFRECDKTIFFVSHGLGQIRSFCNKAMWLEYGVLKAIGDTEPVLKLYEEFLAMYNKMSKEEKDEYTKQTIQNQSHLLLQ